MQQSIATIESSSTSESLFGQSGKPLLVRLWSMLTGLGLKASAVLFRILERLGFGISEPINIDRISARLRVAQRAKSDGENEYPPSIEKSMSGTQREIIAHFKQLQRRAQRRIKTSADKARRIRQRIDLAGMEGTLRDIPSRCENDLRRMLAEWQPRLNSPRNDAMERSQGHSQKTEAASKVAEQSVPAVLQFAFLAAVVSGCAFLLNDTSALGLGGESLVARVWIFVILLAIAILSSAIALATSSGISNDGSFWRLRKWLRAGTGIAFIGLTCVVASHYLLRITANPDTSLSAVFAELFVARTVPLLPLENWTVFSIVSAAALITFIVCYRDDSPDGSRHRPRKKRSFSLNQLRKVNAKIDQAQVEVTATVKRAKAALGKYARLVDESRHLSAKQSDYDYVLEDACNMLLDRYRIDNSKVRTTEAPHSFQEHVYFRAEEDASLASFADEAHHLNQFQQEIGALESQAAQIRQALRDLNSHTIRTLEESVTP
jgi:hypothetical protein